MELNEIKKKLYTQKPSAKFIKASNVSLTYSAIVNLAKAEGLNCHLDIRIYFHIPISDIGDATFENTMPAQQLIRWLVIPETK